MRDEVRKEFSSTDDRRASAQPMRHSYRVLTDEEKKRVAELKDIGDRFLMMLHVIGNTGAEERMASRELSIAQTKIEEAVMWAVKHVTA